MKINLLILLIVIILGGGFIGYWFIIRDNAPGDGNTNTTVNYTNTANQTLKNNATNPVSVTMPTPLSSWNTDYEPSNTELQTLPSSIEDGLAACGDNNYCLRELAVGFRDARVCEKLDLSAKPFSFNTPSEEIRDCFRLFGLYYDAYDCSVHQDQKVRDMCYWVFSSGSFVDNPIDGCLNISDSEIRAVCQESLQGFSNINSLMTEVLSSTKELALSQCYVQKNPAILNQLPQNELTDEFYAEAAKGSFGFGGCDEYTQAEIDGALEKLLTDADEDGVVLALEEFFGSSDASNDSDGDGYSDLEEIIGGYNPNGPGDLSLFTF